MTYLLHVWFIDDNNLGLFSNDNYEHANQIFENRAKTFVLSFIASDVK